MMNRHAARAAAAVLLGFLLAVGGCGPSTGTVTGKVTHKGKPVVWGTITMIASDNIPYSGSLNPDGTYSIVGVRGGPVKIGVMSPNPDGATRGSTPVGGRPGAGAAGDLGGKAAAPAQPAVALPAPGAWFALPDKYADPLQSGLTGTVQGDTVLNVDLP
jgi:hypothetical protein